MRILQLTKAQILVMILFFGIGSTVFGETFVHPGLSHKKSDLDRIKCMVKAKVEPYYSSYQDLISNPTASYDYVVQGDVSITTYGLDPYGWKDARFCDDARSAYYGALRWYIEEDERYAEKAIESLMAWSGLTNHPGMSLKTAPIWLMIEAAELIKHTYDGWSEADQKKFADMLVYPGYSNTTAPTGNKTWYWNAYLFDNARAGNQELCGIRTVAAMGVFLDNKIMYDRAMRYVSNLPARADDIAYVRGPRIQGEYNESGSNEFSDSYDVPDPENTNANADWGFCGVLPYNIYPNGQNVESSRDQAHTSFSLGLLSTLGEIGWSQSYDFYGLLDSRLVKGLEYTLRYCVSADKSFPDQTTPWEPTTFVDLEGYEEPELEHASYDFIQISNRTKRNKSQNISTTARDEYPGYHTWELPIAHYVGRGIKTEDDLKWTIRARDYAREVNGKYEAASTGQDYTGYGALFYYRPEGCSGDPISGFNDTIPVYDMNMLPCVIEAENYDFNPINAEGRIYHDIDAANTAGEYRVDQGVDVDVCSEGGYQLSSLEDGEWLTYTVAVSEAGYYDINLRYAAANAAGKIKFSFDNVDQTDEVAIPFGGEYSTGLNNYADFTVESKILLQAGVQAMKVYISGASNSFVINSISIDATSTLHIEAEDYSEMSGVSVATTSDAEGLSQVESFDAGDWLTYEIYIPYTQNYNFEYRLASADAGEYTVMLDDVIIENYAYTATGGADLWESQTSGASFPLRAGTHTLKLTTNTSGSSLNWIDILSDEVTCDVTEVLPYFTTYNPGGVDLGMIQTDSISVIPGYSLNLSLEPEFGGAWSWSGPNGFTSTERELEFASIQTANEGEYTVQFTNDCGVSSTQIITIKVSDSQLVEAESYSAMSGVELETTTDEGAGQDVTSIDVDDWMAFDVNVPYTGNYLIDYRVAGTAAGNFTISSDSIDLETVSFDATGGEQNWTTVSSLAEIHLSEGVQTLRIKANSASWKLNWFQLSLQEMIMPCNLPFEFSHLDINNQIPEWSTGLLDISCEDSVNLFMDIQSLAGIGANESITVHYKLDGGSETLLAEQTGVLELAKWSVTGIKGKTIEVIIRGNVSSDEAYTLSNIRISISPVFTKLEAEDFDTYAGIDTQSTNDTGGGENVGWVHNGDWIMFKDIDLTGANSFYTRYSGITDGSAIEVRLATEDGALISTVDLPKTGSWTTVQENIEETVGSYDVYFIFTGDDGYLFNLNWLQFSTEILLSTESSLFSSVYTIVEDNKTILNVPLGTLVSAFESNLEVSEKASINTFQPDGVSEATEIIEGCKVIVTAEDGVSKTTYIVDYLSSEAIATSEKYTVDQDNLTISDVPEATLTILVKHYLDLSEGATMVGYEADGTTEASKMYAGYKVVITSEDGTTTTTYTIVGTSGVDEISSDEVLLYPNPVRDNLTIVNQVGATIEIYTQLGRRMLSVVTDTPEVMIAMSDYNSGIYIVKVSNEDKALFYRVIKE